MKRETGRSSSSAGTARKPLIVVSVERDTANTYTVVRLTFTQAGLRRAKRLMLALLVWVTAAPVGSYISTFAQALR